MSEGSSDDSMAPRRRLCAQVDLQGYGSRLEEPAQRAAQGVLAEALDLAAVRTGLARPTWHKQEAGDGELAVLTDPDAEPVMVGRFPTALSEALWELAPREGYRVRLGLHHGITARAAMGYSGDGPREVARITDSDVVRRALASAPAANLVLALSNGLYLDTVRAGRAGVDCRHFHEVRVVNKEFRGRAWLHLPGVEPAWRPPAPDDEPPAEAAGPGTVTQHAYGHHTYQAGRDLNIGPTVHVDGDLYAPMHFGRRRG